MPAVIGDRPPKEERTVAVAVFRSHELKDASGAVASGMTPQQSRRS